MGFYKTHADCQKTREIISLNWIAFYLHNTLICTVVFDYLHYVHCANFTQYSSHPCSIAHAQYTVHTHVHVQCTPMIMYSAHPCPCTVHTHAHAPCTPMLMHSAHPSPCTVHTHAPAQCKPIPMHNA